MLLLTLLLLVLCATSDEKTIRSQFDAAHHQQERQPPQPASVDEGVSDDSSPFSAPVVSPSSLHQRSSFSSNSSSPLPPSRRLAHPFPVRGRQFRQAYETSLTQLFGLTSRPARRGGRRHQSIADVVPPFMTELYQRIVAESYSDDSYDGMFPVPADVLQRYHAMHGRKRGEGAKGREALPAEAEWSGRHKRHYHHRHQPTVNTVRSFAGNILTFTLDRVDCSRYIMFRIRIACFLFEILRCTLHSHAKKFN